MNKFIARAGALTIGIFILGLIYMIYICNYIRPEIEAAENSATVFKISKKDLEKLKISAKNGDCGSATRIANHYSFSTELYEEAIYWLRIAAKCPDPNAKAALVMTLATQHGKYSDAEEIDKLIKEIETLDPSRAQFLKKDYAIAHKDNEPNN